MKLSDPIKIALRSLVAAKTRFLLTTLGIVIGVAAVILVLAIGASAQRLILSQVEKVGTNLVAILPGAAEESGPPAQAFGVVTTTLVQSDLAAMRERRHVPHLVAAAGYVTGAATVEAGSEAFEMSYQGVSPAMVDVENIDLAAGRFFFLEEENNLSRVVVLGHARAQELFPRGEPLGATIKIKDIPFQVVGILAERGATAFSNPDTLIYVPLATAQKLLLGINYINFVRGKVDSAENVGRTVTDITVLLRDRHHIDEGEESDFSVRNTASALSLLTNVTNVLKYFLAAIASISLLVGGIGIMNSMLIAVSQRVREIGLRKAVGARPWHIITQFLIEAACLTLLGGIIGIGVGVALAYVVALVLPRLGYTWEFLVPPLSLALGFGVSLLIGFIFGLYPAVRAARVSPMEALRYE